MEWEEYLEIYGESEKRGMKRHLHGSMDYAKTLKLQFRAGDLDLPERRGMPPVVGRRKEIHIYALVAKESGAHMVGECEMHKEGRDVIEMRKLDEHDTEYIGTLDIVVARKRSLS